MADEALKCITSLLESIPTWISDLENIVKSATERQKEILRENQPVDCTQNQSHKPSKSKTSSVKSKRSKLSKDGKQHPAKPDETDANFLRTQLPHMTQSDALRLAQRKRKTASVCSDRVSGPLKFRSRSMVVVYYDGDTQKSFENIVRSIGTCRNSLRRGQNSARVDILSRSGSNGTEASQGEDVTMAVRKMPYRSARMRHSPLSNRNDGTEIFDKIDGFLEKAQNLCERAAHQVLRDGDCGLEIKNAKEHFVDAQKLSDAELPTWRKRAEMAAEKRRLSEERKLIEEDEQEEKTPPDYSSSEKLVSDDPFSSPGTLEVDLEVDDSDGGDDRDFAVNVMQLGRPYFRTSRLTAV